MKKFIICALLVLCGINAIAQNTQDIGKVMLGVKVADDATVETKQVSQQLQSRLSQIATQAGYSSNGASLFAICPNVIVNYIDVAEGGMKPIYVVQGDLALTIAGGADGTVFHNDPLRCNAQGGQTVIHAPGLGDVGFIIMLSAGAKRGNKRQTKK